MKLLTISRGRYQIKLDDEDFERISEFRWRVYVSPVHTPTIRGYDFTARKMISLASQFVPFESKDYLIRFRDGDKFNWQKANLDFTFRDVSGPKRLVASWCPYGEAVLLPAWSGRPEICLACPDHVGGPYWRCLCLVAKTFWRGWRREDERTKRQMS